MQCKNCNRTIPDDARFCPNCGAVVNHSTYETTQTEPQDYHNETQDQDTYYRNFAPNQAGTYTNRPQVLENRSFLVMFLLSIVTCGIYELVFLYRLSEDVNTICEGDGKSTMNYIVALLLSIVTCGVYGIIWYYLLAQRLEENARQRYNFQPQANANLILVLSVVGYFAGGVTILVALYLIIQDVNRMSQLYNMGA